MNLTDLNSGREIGSNCLHLELGPFSILVDAGMHPKKIGTEALPDFSRIPDHSLDLVLLTHCHLDHIGGLPVVLRQQPQAQVLMSLPTLTLGPRMLRNSCNVMRRQRDELGIKEYPLFSFEEIERLENTFTALPFGKTRQVEKEGQTLEITLYRAGHVAGACGFLLVYKHRRIFITGDVLFNHQRTLPGADFPTEKLDVLIIETTRGATERDSDYEREEEIDRLLHAMADTLHQGGSVLIPVFALGRMQEMIRVIHDARTARLLPECPVTCSGLGMDLFNYFDTIARKTGLIQFNRKWLHELKVKPLRATLVPGKDPGEKGIFLLSSGMLVEHTPSYAAAASMLAHPHNLIAFVGYCDPDTPGGRLLDTPQNDSFLFEQLDYVTEVRARIERFDLSGHADRDELIDFALETDPRCVVLTHGDPPAREWFNETLEERAPHIQRVDPIPGKTYVV